MLTSLSDDLTCFCLYSDIHHSFVFFLGGVKIFSVKISKSTTPVLKNVLLFGDLNLKDLYYQTK